MMPDWEDRKDKYWKNNPNNAPIVWYVLIIPIILFLLMLLGFIL